MSDASTPSRVARPARMVFHAPFPVRPGSSRASGIRPWKMLQGFRQAGFEVRVVTGYAAQRRASLRSLERAMKEGWVPEFVYSEAATLPSSLTEPRHLPLILNLERKFFRDMHDRGIPSGVFYRDVYWAFPEYRKSVGPLLYPALRYLYGREIETFNHYVDVLFLPSVEMAQFVPGLRGPRPVALPPGTDPKDVPLPKPGAGSLRVLYVGDIGGGHYDMAEFLRAVSETEGVSLTICTRSDSMARAREQYADVLKEADNITFVQASGEDLLPLYRSADIASLVVRPDEYRSFAAPMKLWEYMAMGRPVLTTTGTKATTTVEAVGAGWGVVYDADSIAKSLRRLRDNPQVVVAASKAAREFGLKNTWRDRARFVAQTLTAGG